MSENTLERINEVEQQLNNIKQDITLEPSEDVEYKKLILATLYTLTLDEHIGDVKGTVKTVIDKLDVPFEFNGMSELNDTLTEYGIGYTDVGEEDGITIYDLPDRNGDNQ